MQLETNVEQITDDLGVQVDEAAVAGGGCHGVPQVGEPVGDDPGRLEGDGTVVGDEEHRAGHALADDGRPDAGGQLT